MSNTNNLKDYKTEINAYRNAQATEKLLTPFLDLKIKIEDLGKNMKDPSKLAGVVNEALTLCESRQVLLSKVDGSKLAALEQYLTPILSFEQEIQGHMWQIIETCIDVASN